MTSLPGRPCVLLNMIRAYASILLLATPWPNSNHYCARICSKKYIDYTRSRIEESELRARSSITLCMHAREKERFKVTHTKSCMQLRRIIWRDVRTKKFIWWQYILERRGLVGLAVCPLDHSTLTKCGNVLIWVIKGVGLHRGTAIGSLTGQQSLTLCRSGRGSLCAIGRWATTWNRALRNEELELRTVCSCMYGIVTGHVTPTDSDMAVITPVTQQAL